MALCKNLFIDDALPHVLIALKLGARRLER